MKPNPNKIYLAMDSHTLTYGQSCEKKYWLNAVEHLHERRERLVWDPATRSFKKELKFNAFSLGTFVHDMLERRSKLGLRLLQGKKLPFNYPVTDATLLKIGHKRIARCRMFDQDEKLFHSVKWLECCAELKKQESYLKPVGAEIGFSKVIYEDNDVCFLYEGRIDYIARNEHSGILSWVDYKTQSRDYVLYENPNQFLGYSWVLGTNLGYIQYYGLQAGGKNASSEQSQKDREKAFRLEPIYHHPQLVEQWKNETINTFRKFAGLIQLGEPFFKRNRAACTTAWGTCAYVSICDNAWARAEVIEGIKRTRFKKEQWHPWRIKEITNGQ